MRARERGGEEHTFSENLTKLLPDAPPFVLDCEYVRMTKKTSASSSSVRMGSSWCDALKYLHAMADPGTFDERDDSEDRKTPIVSKEVGVDDDDAADAVAVVSISSISLRVSLPCLGYPNDDRSSPKTQSFDSRFDLTSILPTHHCSRT